jgi:PAS domain S-box-containing protein
MRNREGGASNDRAAGLSTGSMRPLLREPAAWLLATLAFALLAFAAIWAAGIGDQALIGRLTGTIVIPAAPLAILISLRLGRSAWLDRDTARAWNVLGLALGSYFAGAACNFIGHAVPGLWFLTLLAPALELAAYILGATGFGILPKAWRLLSDEIVFGLDVAIVAWSASIMLWHFVIYPAAQADGAGMLTTAAAAVYPVADLSFVFAVGAILLRGVRPSTRNALVVVLLALLAAFAGDMIAGLESLQDKYRPGGLSGVLYSVTWLGLGLGALLQSQPDRGPQRVRQDSPTYSFVWLPYVAVAIAFTAPAINDWNDINLLRQHLPATGLLIALVVARLGVTAWQNAHLATAERERLATAVDQAAESIVMADGAGVITYVNPAFTRITGHTATEAVGRHGSFLTDGASDQNLLTGIRTAFDRGDTWGGRLRYWRSDRSMVDIDLAVSPLRDASGSVVGSVEIARDVSREIALEAQLTEAQRMEAIGRLAGGIAHDFNNILTAISGFAELAADNLPADHPVADDVTQIVKASERAAALTQALLAFSRRQVMQPQVLDLNEVVVGVSPMLARLIGEDVELAVHAEPALGCTMADRGQFEQVVMNLVVNARDAMPKGGRLTIETGNVELGDAYARAHVGAVAGPHVMLAVRDNGLGMTPEVLEHAFEPFFTTKGHGKGTGLGLSTVIGIVAQSGGSIDVQSSPGKGTDFRIYLPRVDTPSHDEGPSHPSSSGRPGTETILVAEDEPAVRLFVERVLRHAGYKVYSASNGEEALAVASTLDRLDLLFTDMVMPGMGGPELVLALAAVRPGLRNIYASGYTDDASFRSDVSDSTVPYLAKPFTASALLAMVREVLDSPPPGAQDGPAGRRSRRRKTVAAAESPHK